MTDKENLIYDIALTMVPGFGPVTIKKTLTVFGNARNFFSQKEKELFSSPFVIKNNPVRGFKDQLLSLAEQEINFCEKNGIEILTVNDKNYPRLLRETYDPPYIIYVKGNTNLNDHAKPLAVVGTRKATQYGKSACSNTISGLKNIKGISIISGLALGIDTCAHKSALDSEIPTIAVLGHGFAHFYPARNKNLAREIIENGGTLITEYTKDTTPDGFNFVKRNRIIAGMTLGTLVVESGIKGGSLITANLALSYNREVMAFPGRIGDNRSEGCNMLIKRNKAALVENAGDIVRLMNWDLMQPTPPTHKEVSLSKEERLILETIEAQGKININTLAKITGMDISNLSLHLINLEMKNIVKSLPGNFYDII